MEQDIRLYKFLTFFNVFLAILTNVGLLLHYEGVFTLPRPWAGWVGLFFMTTGAIASNEKVKELLKK